MSTTATWCQVRFYLEKGKKRKGKRTDDGKKKNVTCVDLDVFKRFTETRPPRPLLEHGDCEERHLACGDGTCFPAAYFCDGSVDCPDGSDEGGWCSKKKRILCYSFTFASFELYSVFFFFFFRSTDARNDPDGALPCDPGECHLPDCWCSKDGRTIPGNLTVSTVPQMIAVTFDDAVNGENIELFSSKENQPRY